MWRVGHIEQFGSKLDPDILGHRKVPKDRQVKIDPGRTPEDISATVSVTIEISTALARDTAHRLEGVRVIVGIPSPDSTELNHFTLHLVSCLVIARCI